ncbi:hypothetical protein SCUCBS95973_005717 [Sporothrix curviconia]|uniref:Uncharacterized protein n=1 Tax=Sporothrix curviconia TaxID=1260050 RepID=A0ABP0C042_9PEZI
MKLSALALTGLVCFADASTPKRHPDTITGISPATPLLVGRGVCQRDGTDYGIAVALATGSIIQAQVDGANGLGATTSSKHRRESGEPALSGVDIFVQQMAQLGFTHGQIKAETTAPPPAAAGQRRSTTDGGDEDADASDGVPESFVIRNVTDPSGSFTAADYHYTLFHNGTGFLHVIHTPAPAVGARSDDNSHAALGKRHDGAGFKYNWNRMIWTPAVEGADINTLAFDIGSYIAQNLAYDADFFLLDQYICAIGIDYILMQAMGVAIRIIPELTGFGEEYEDVDICGDVYTAIQDELRRDVSPVV